MGSLQDYYIELREQLSVRAMNVLKINNLFECSAFLLKTAKPRFSFMDLKNCGKKTADELDSVIKKLREFQIDNVENEPTIVKDEKYSQFEIWRKIKTPIVDYDLSARSVHCLNKVGINTLGDLVTLDKDSILRIRALGKSSFQEIENMVVSEGLNFGMDISGYCSVNDIEKQYEDSRLSFLSKVDKDYVFSFKDKIGHFPMIFLLYKALGILTEYEREVLKLSWGIKNSSILPYYNTLDDISKWTEETITPMPLDEIANAFCLTRERIRQKFDKANKRLNTNGLIKQLSQYEDWNNYKIGVFQPFLFFNDLTFEKTEVEREYIVEYIKDHSSAKWISEFVAGVPCISVNLCCFIIRLKGMIPYWIDFDKKELYPRYNSTETTVPFLFVNSQLAEYNYGKAVKEICRLHSVRKTDDVVIPIISYFIENEKYWNRKCKPSEIERENILHLLIRLAQTLCDVQIEDNSFLFKANRVDYNNLLYDILRTAGGRLHRDELFVNLKNVCQEKGLNNFDYTEPAQITQFLTRDSRIVPIGKSSYWGLREWGELFGSIRELSIKLVKKHKKPIHINDLIISVMDVRPDSNEKSINSVIRQSIASGELLLFYDDLIGYPEAKYIRDYTLMPQTFEEWLQAFKDFVLKNKRYPTNNQKYEGYLYRWHHRASQLTELSPDEIIQFDALEKELYYYPHNTMEYNFLHNCDLYRKFVDGNNRMLEQTDDINLFKWFSNASIDYGTYEDNRKLYFSKLLQYISSKLY